MGQLINVCIILCVIPCYFQVQGGSKYTDENRPYEFGFTIEGEQHRHEKKDENGIIMGEFGFITADGVYHVTVYATDENGNFKILSMKNIRVKPYPAAPNTGAREGHSLSSLSPQKTPTKQAINSRQPIKQEVSAGPAKSCSHCGVPTTTTTSPRVLNTESLLRNNKVNENSYSMDQKQSNNKYGSHEQNSEPNYSPQTSFGNNALTQFTRIEQNNVNQVADTGKQYPENIEKPAELLDTPLTANYLQNSDKQQNYQKNLGIKGENSQLPSFTQTNSQSLGTINSNVQSYQQSYENYSQDSYTGQTYSQSSNSQGSSSEQIYPQMPSSNQGGSAGQIYTEETGSTSEHSYGGYENHGSTKSLSMSSISGSTNSEGVNEISEPYQQQDAGKQYSQGPASLGSSTGPAYPQEPQSYQPGLISGTVSPGGPVLNLKNEAFNSDLHNNNGNLPSEQEKRVSQPANFGNRHPKNFDEILQSVNTEKQYNSDGPKSISLSQSNIGGLPKKPVLVAAQMQIVDKNTDIYHKKPGEEDGLPKGLTNDDMKQLLYTFNYTVGFHGHHEEGYTNGAKYGYYYVTGRNGIRTRVDYVADNKGFHPKITQEVLDVLSDEVPKPETEKDEKYGLKGYEFKWLYYPVESS